MDRSIEGANLAVTEIEQRNTLAEEVKNTIQMLDKCSMDAEPARTKVSQQKGEKGMLDRDEKKRETAAN